MRYFIIKDGPVITGFLQADAASSPNCEEVTKEEYENAGGIVVAERTSEIENVKTKLKLTEARVDAVIDRGEFIEDCIAEISTVVYS